MNPRPRSSTARPNAVPFQAALALWTALAAGFLPTAPLAAPTEIEVDVDAREAPRHLFHSTLAMTVDGTPLTLAYPRWLPGDHGPSGPIANLVGLAFEVEGRPVAWERDTLDPWQVRLVPPPGRLTARLTFADVGPGTIGSTAKLALVPWSSLVLVPLGADAGEVRVRASLLRPAGWTSAGALAPEGETPGPRVRFAEVSLERLVDSPILMGAHGRVIDLTPGREPAHRIALFGDTPESIAASAEQVAAWQRLVDEGRALFGDRSPYGAYTFLLAFSDEIDSFGLEHAASTEIRLPERTLSEDAPRLSNASLVPHEFVHAWNGKYRRPAGLFSPDLARPMRTGELWIYEGLTEYWGWVLAGRSGLLRIDEAHDELAVAAALMDLRAGRSWRSLRDTGLSAHALYAAEGSWTSLRRGTDFYHEGALVWLEVDATIRARSRGRRSLDDFARAFFAPPAGSTPGMDEPLAPVPYERADIVEALAAIEPYDWATFFADRVDRPTTRAPLGGIEQAGFRLAYRDSVTPYVAAYEGLTEKADLRFALGVRIDGEGAIDDVIPDSPAGRAGLAPGEVVVAVNDRAYAEPVLRDALIATGRDSTARFDLLVRSATFFRTVSLSGVRGDRRPALLRLPGAADGLGAILAPRTGRPRRH